MSGLATKFVSHPFGKSAIFARLAPSSFFREFGITRDIEVQGVLDASGFKYGDPWGSQGYEDLTRQTSLCRQRRQKFILLPQSFGPIRSKGDRDRFRRACDQIDLIFPRDRDSLALLVELDVQANFVLRPDFTVAVPGWVGPSDAQWKDHVVIVPNMRMLDKLGDRQGQKYVELLTSVLRHLLDTRVQVACLAHSPGDEAITGEVAKAVGQELPLISLSDPQRIKGVLGLARVVVGSRYHALVSALTQGVPCLGFGWSHKYRDLFSDFGFDPYLVDVDASEQVVLQLLAELLDQQRRAGTTRLLLKASKAYQEQTVSMWQETAKAIQPE